MLVGNGLPPLGVAHRISEPFSNLVAWRPFHTVDTFAEAPSQLEHEKGHGRTQMTGSCLRNVDTECWSAMVCHLSLLLIA